MEYEALNHIPKSKVTTCILVYQNSPCTPQLSINQSFGYHGIRFHWSVKQHRNQPTILLYMFSSVLDLISLNRYFFHFNSYAMSILPLGYNNSFLFYVLDHFINSLATVVMAQVFQAKMSTKWVTMHAGTGEDNISTPIPLEGLIRHHDFSDYNKTGK